MGLNCSREERHALDKYRVVCVGETEGAGAGAGDVAVAREAPPPEAVAGIAARRRRPNRSESTRSTRSHVAARHTHTNPTPTQRHTPSLPFLVLTAIENDTRANTRPLLDSDSSFSLFLSLSPRAGQPAATHTQQRTMEGMSPEMMKMAMEQMVRGLAFEALVLG